MLKKTNTGKIEVGEEGDEGGRESGSLEGIGMESEGNEGVEGVEEVEDIGGK